MTTKVMPADLLGKDPTKMTTTELVRSMADVCLPESKLSAHERASMYIVLILEATRRDKDAPQ